MGRGNAARTVVELGCGACALPGRAAAAMGGRVTLTDGAPALLPVLRKLDGVEVCLYNFAGGGAFDGLDASAEPSEPPAPADLVLGAEIAYRAADAEALADYPSPAGRRRHRRPVLGREAGALGRAGAARKRGFVVEDSVLALTVAPDEGAAATRAGRAGAAEFFFFFLCGGGVVVLCCLLRCCGPIVQAGQAGWSPAQAQASYGAGSPAPLPLDP